MAAKPWNVVPLVLPVNGKEYSIQPLAWDDGLTFIATFNASGEKDGHKGLPKDATDEVLYRHCMGSVWDEMVSDGCPHQVLQRAGWAALQYQTGLVIFGEEPEAAAEAAEKVWENGPAPEAVAAVLAAKQQTPSNPPATSKRSTSTAAARKTPSPASTSGTRSPKATPRSGSKAAASRSTGRRSSSSSRSS